MASSTTRTSSSLTRRGLFTAAALTVPTGAAVTLASAPPVHADPSVTDGDTRIVEVPLADATTRKSDDGTTCRVVESVAATMLAASWDGEAPERIQARGLTEDDDWTPWTALELADASDAPDVPATLEPVWLGTVTEIEVRATRADEDVTAELTAHVLTTSPTSFDEEVRDGQVESLSSLNAASARAASNDVELGPEAPTIIRRSAWGADESLVGSVSAATALKGVVVHHTAGSNSYSKADAAQLVRGILSYHTETLGWADVGYNILVDKYGQIFEGRSGGLHRFIVGAHAYAFNTYTCGVSVMGDYTSSAPPKAALTALYDVIAWKLLGAGLTDPDRTSPWKITATGGGILFDEGETVELPRVFAHRDVNSTECPGDAFYATMNTVRSEVGTRMDDGWRVHQKQFVDGGSASVYGTVTQIPHIVGSYCVTRLREGLILSEGSDYTADAAAYVTPFASDWTSSWGRPTGDAETEEGTTTQAFEKGTASQKGEGDVTFSAS